MADNLDDEWWRTDENTKINDSGSNAEEEDAKENERNISERKGMKRTKEDDEKSFTKKQKKRKRKKITAELAEKGDANRGSPHDLINTITKHFEGKLSTVEWDELKLDPESDFYCSSEVDHTPSSYLRTVLPKWKKMVKTAELKPGSPLVLIITSSAIRAVQLNREITDFKTDDCKCVKLFAKHFKIEEQQKYLSKSICHLGLGTPNRISSLLKTESLHLENVKCAILDWNWRDIKSKRMTDIIDIRKDLLSLLKTYIIPHIHHSKCKIGIL